MKEGWMKNDEGWMKDEGRMMNDEEWMMKSDDFKLLWGFDYRRTDRQTDNNCDCRVAFATEKTSITGMHARNWRILLTKHMLDSFP